MAAIGLQNILAVRTWWWWGCWSVNTLQTTATKLIIVGDETTHSCNTFQNTFPQSVVAIVTRSSGWSFTQLSQYSIPHAELWPSWGSHNWDTRDIELVRQTKPCDSSVLRQITGKEREVELVLFIQCTWVKIIKLLPDTDSHNIAAIIWFFLFLDRKRSVMSVRGRRLGRGYYDRRGGEKSAAWVMTAISH